METRGIQIIRYKTMLLRIEKIGKNYLWEVVPTLWEIDVKRGYGRTAEEAVTQAKKYVDWELRFGRNRRKI